MYKEFRTSGWVQFIFVLSLTISCIAIVLIEQSRYQQKRVAIKNISSSYANLIKANINHALSAAYPLAALVRIQKGSVSKFEALATQMLPFYTGVGSLQLAPDGIIQHIVPLSGNENLIGHNLLTEPNQNKKAFLAKNIEQLTLAGSFDLVQGKMATIGHLPVFVDTKTGNKSFWGLTSVVIFFPDVLKTISLESLEKDNIAYVLSRINPNTDKTEIIARSNKSLIEEPEQFIIMIPNSQWVFKVSPIESWTNYILLYIEIFVGLFFSLLITLSLTLLTCLKNNNKYLKETIIKRTQKLADNEARLAALVENAVDAIITINEQGLIQSFNTAAINMFGYSPEEVLNKNINILMPNPFKDDHDKFIANYLESGKNKIIGIGREVVAQHKNGDIFPIDLGVSQIHLNNGNFLFSGIIRDITEKKEREQTLQLSLDAAKKANRAKAEFLSSMSHELRTPMNAVLGFSELLASDTEAPLTHDQQESLEYIVEGGNHLLSLINDVLDLSKIESGHANIILEPVDVKTIIFQVCHLMQHQAEQHAITINNTTAEQQSFLINADRRKLKQVLLNLFSNAIKYNSEEGYITVSLVKNTNKKLRVCIHDTGEGVAEKLMPRIFDPFDRLNMERSSIQGTGIGLTICKELVELMGGEIGVFSNANQGMTFWIEFELV